MHRYVRDDISGEVIIYTAAFMVYMRNMEVEAADIGRRNGIIYGVYVDRALIGKIVAFLLRQVEKHMDWIWWRRTFRSAVIRLFSAVCTSHEQDVVIYIRTPQLAPWT